MDTNGNSSSNVQGLTGTQALVLSVICNPAPFLEKYETITRGNIATYLNLPREAVALAFSDPALIDAITRASLSNLHAHRARVDAALIASATTHSSYNNADRKLYYVLLGIDKGVPNKKVRAGEGMSRTDKVDFLHKFLKDHLKLPIRKDTLSGKNNPAKRGTASKNDTGGVRGSAEAVSYVPPESGDGNRQDTVQSARLHKDVPGSDDKPTW